MDGMKGGARDALDETMEADAAAAEPIADAPAAEDDAEGGARAELAALNDRHLRLAAEFDNYRRRTERERIETWGRSQAELAGGLLDVLDDLGRVAHLDASTASSASLLDGMQLVERKLQRALAAAGLEEIDPEGERFDPATMEALMMVEADEPGQDDTVAGVLQKGYRFKGHLLRPARVQVRKYND